jgi:hypothetical protein
MQDQWPPMIHEGGSTHLFATTYPLSPVSKRPDFVGPFVLAP